MSERAKKSIGQDLVGILFCVLGGFFTVSIAMHLIDRQPVVGFATQPVLALVSLLGPAAGMTLSLGAAAIGAWIFLATQPPSIGRPLATIALAAAGVALVLGAFAWGGSLGDAFPGLVAGTPGRLIGAVLGVAVLFLAVTLLPTRRSGASTSDMMLGSRGDLASGVSAAEAALLVTDTRSAPRPAPRREEPLRETTVRPLAPPGAPRPAASVIAAPPRPVPIAPAPAELPTPTAPAWESDELEEEPASAPLAAADLDDDAEEAELAAELAQALTLEDEGEEELEPEQEPGAEPSAAAASPAASWEQVSLFDEEVEEEEAAEEAPAPAAPVSATLDFGTAVRPLHEPERATADDPFAAEPVMPPAPVFAAEPEEVEPEEADEEGEEEEDGAAEDFEPEASEPEVPAAEPVAEPVAVQPPPAPRAPEPVEQPEFVLQPKPAVQKAEPVLARDGERERWDKLVFDAGVVVLEQKRVAVSMLERRFGIDFDTACRVLDELQQAGLIGPYIGGRTRDILLSREQWLAQAHETA